MEAEAGVHATPEFYALSPVRWERLSEPDVSEHDSANSLFEHLVACIENLQADVQEELAVRLELSGPASIASSLAQPGRREELEEELIQRTGVVEVQVDCDEVACG